MNNTKESKAIKIPVLTDEEFQEWGRVVHSKDEELEKKFWRKIYFKRGLTYNSDEKLMNEFDELVSSGRMHLNFADGTSLEDLTDDEKINVMKILNKHKKK
mgnify:CR=1 FL=1